MFKVPGEKNVRERQKRSDCPRNNERKNFQYVKEGGEGRGGLLTRPVPFPSPPTLVLRGLVPVPARSTCYPGAQKQQGEQDPSVRHRSSANL